jgi:hypothetical protein
LTKFVAPLIDQWNRLQVSHLLSVIFFARTLFPETDHENSKFLSGSRRDARSKLLHPLPRNRDGIFYKDYFKTVVESITEYDKKSILRQLKEEFWSFPKSVGWNIIDQMTFNDPSIEEFGLPSGAASGNFLEAINSTLNVLDKHFIDRDLQRSGNSVVLISAGTGIFRVTPTLQQITKQRMMDNGIGMDFISLSQPPLHTIPMFLIECSNEIGNFESLLCAETMLFSHVNDVDIQSQ